MSLVQFPSNGIAAYSRHIQVTDYYVRSDQATHFESFFASKYGMDFIALVAKYCRQRSGCVSIVIDDDHAQLEALWLSVLSIDQAQRCGHGLHFSEPMFRALRRCL